MPCHFNKIAQICLKCIFPILQHCFIKGTAQNTSVHGALTGPPHGKKEKPAQLPPYPVLKNYLLVPTHPLTAFKKIDIFRAQ